MKMRSTVHSKFEVSVQRVEDIRSLNGGLVRNWCDCFRQVVLDVDSRGTTWLGWLSLKMNVYTVGLCSPHLLRVRLDTLHECLPALGVLDVLDTNVDTLLHVAVSHNFVDNHTNGRLGDVIHNAGLSMVVLMRHTVWRISSCRAISVYHGGLTNPFWTAPLTLMSTISPTRYCVR